MTTIPASVKAQLDADWTGAGGAEPPYYVAEDYRTNPPLGGDSIWILDNTDVDPQIVNDSFVNEFLTIDIVVTATTADRLKEIGDEVVRILNASRVANVTYQRYKRRRNVSGVDVNKVFINQEIVTYDMREQMKSAAAAYGPGATGPFTVLSLTFTVGGATVTTILDEDAMGSDSATSLATQQSIKAYADLMLPLTGGTMSGELKADGGIDTSGANLIFNSNNVLIASLSGSDNKFYLFKPIRWLAENSIECTANVNMKVGNDFDDYWYFSTSGNIASILPVEDKVHLIGSAILSADNMYSDDFTNTSPFKKFDSPLSELKKITHKDDKIDYKSIPEWIRAVGRDPVKQITHKETRLGLGGEEEEYDVVDERAPKDVVLDNAWSVNRMVVLLYQALQEATARIEALEAR